MAAFFLPVNPDTSFDQKSIDLIWTFGDAYSCKLLVKAGTLFSDNNAYGTRPILFTLNEHRKIRCVPHFWGTKSIYNYLSSNYKIDNFIVTKSGKSFVTGGSENVISGVGALIGAGINMLMGSGEGVQAEHSDYFIMVDGLALVRIDVKSWIRKVTVVGITQKIESVLAFTAVKSSVDVDKISFNTFMEAYPDFVNAYPKTHH